MSCSKSVFTKTLVVMMYKHGLIMEHYEFFCSVFDLDSSSSYTFNCLYSKLKIHALILWISHLFFLLLYFFSFFVHPAIHCLILLTRALEHFNGLCLILADKTSPLNVQQMVLEEATQNNHISPNSQVAKQVTLVIYILKLPHVCNKNRCGL